MSPRIALLAAVLLLGLTSAASAEDAWVLWATYSLQGDWETKPVHAYESAALCEVGRVRAEKIELPGAAKGMTAVFQCLPDTIDPRWPKGKP